MTLPTLGFLDPGDLGQITFPSLFQRGAQDTGDAQQGEAFTLLVLTVSSLLALSGCRITHVGMGLPLKSLGT